MESAAFFASKKRNSVSTFYNDSRNAGSSSKAIAQTTATCSPAEISRGENGLSSQLTDSWQAQHFTRFNGSRSAPRSPLNENDKRLSRGRIRHCAGGYS